MFRLDRTNTSIFGQWWWTVDRYTLVALGLIVLMGTILVMASSPSIAERMGLYSFYFVNRQIIFVLLAVTVTFGISLLSPTHIRRLAFLAFLGCIILLVVVLMLGLEVKGARRWISFFGFTIQPSEFVKPFFIVLNAWILTRGNLKQSIPGYRISIALWAAVAGLLVLQPDIGMTIMISAVWGAQLFLAGLSLVWVFCIGIGGVVGLGLAYFFLPHVADRINNFLDPSSGNSYQNEKALEAFMNGGLFGQGPGEGIVKDIIPDAHTDFIFAVAGEELGLLVCLLIVGLYAFVVVRGFMLLVRETDLFVIYAASGLLIQFGLQSIINMGVTLNLLPNTGMTLPFMSYGGSSMLATAFTMGMVLAFTRKRYGTLSRAQYG